MRIPVLIRFPRSYYVLTNYLVATKKSGFLEKPDF